MKDQMSPREFENYVGLLGRLLRLRTAEREAIADELQAHLEERFAALTERGVDPREAISMALAEFGDAAALAAQFSSVARLQRRRWMMRLGVTSAVSVMLAVAVVVSTWPDASGRLTGATAQAQQPAKPHEESSAFSESNMNAETVAKLEKIGSAHFTEAELGEVLAQFARDGGFQIYVDRTALEERDLGSDTPVTLLLRDVPIEMLLRKTLEPLELTYMLDHGVVIITSREVEESTREIRVYRVDGLVRPAEKTRAAQAGMPGGVGGFMSQKDLVSQVVAPPSARCAAPPLRGNRDMDDLIELITGVVDPESWSYQGGTGVIAEYRGILVVTQTTRIQMKVQRLLTELREAMPAAESRPAIQETVPQDAKIQ